MRYELRLTNFHADDQTGNHYAAASTLDRAVVSRHRTQEAADRARDKRHRGTECMCGCYVVVDTQAGQDDRL